MTTVHLLQSDNDFLDEFLQGTSRTFALAIPLLNAERRLQVGLSYLLFRVADSLEDAPKGDAAVKKQLLAAMKSCFNEPSVRLALNAETPKPNSTNFGGLWPAQCPTERLLLEFPRLMTIFSELPTSVSQAISQALTSTITGMIGFIDASMHLPNQIQLQSLSDLRLYCYAVAGVVGELLTDVFVFHHPPGLAVRKELRHHAVGFGEFLQLINILKDAGHDASHGRIFIPVEATRDSIHELSLRGREDALVYIRLLETNAFPADIISFCRFLYLLADASFLKIRDGGAGSKVTRDEVLRILAEVKSDSRCADYEKTA
jgi:farnesyl-diphosphate farnesyltransferase